MPLALLRDNINIFYISRYSPNPKSSQTIVLIHGAGGNHLSMIPLWDYIKKNHGDSFNMVVFDLPFHFRSMGDQTPEDFVHGKENYCEIINALLEKMQCGTSGIVLIGHSMGAQICLKFASMFPKKTAKVLMIAGCYKTGITDRFIKSLEKSFEKTISLFLSDAYGSRDENIIGKALADIKRSTPKSVINDFKFVRDFTGINKIVSKINLNNLFFDIAYTENDRIIDADCVRELGGMIDKARLTKVDSKNHMDIILKDIMLSGEIDNFLLT